MGLYVEMINVGEGDSFLLTLDVQGGEACILVDGGNRNSGDRVIEHIEKYANGRLARIIGTHIHADHIGGLIEVLKKIKVDELVLNAPENLDSWIGITEQLQAFDEVDKLNTLRASLRDVKELLKVAQEQGVHVEKAFPPKCWDYLNASIKVLNPTRERLAEVWADTILQNLMETLKAPNSLTLMKAGVKAPPTPGNDAGIVLEIEYKGKLEALLTADVSANVLKEVTGGQSYPFLKVPHHGSNSGLDEELILQLKASIAFIPVGKNTYGHPSQKVLGLLKEAGTKTFCSEKTEYCHPNCREITRTFTCHEIHKPCRPDSLNIDPNDCANN